MGKWQVKWRKRWLRLLILTFIVSLRLILKKPPSHNIKINELAVHISISREPLLSNFNAVLIMNFMSLQIELHSCLSIISPKANIICFLKLKNFLNTSFAVLLAPFSLLKKLSYTSCSKQWLYSFEKQDETISSLSKRKFWSSEAIKVSNNLSAFIKILKALNSILALGKKSIWPSDVVLVLYLVGNQWCILFWGRKCSAQVEHFCGKNNRYCQIRRNFLKSS